MKDEYLSDDGSNCCSRNGFTICLAVFLIISLLGLGTVSYFFIQFYLDEGAGETCITIECVKSSAEIDDYVDSSVDACTDFHGFVCGKFIKTGYEKQQQYPLQFEEDKLTHKINSFIVEPVTDDDLKPVILQKRYFQTCLSEERIDESNNNYFHRLFEEIGGWPMLDEEKWSPAKEVSFDWLALMTKAARIGFPFDWFIDVDIHESGHNLLKISKPKSCTNRTPREHRIVLMADISGRFKNSSIIDMERVYKILRFEEQLEDLCRKVSNESLSVNPVLELSKIWFAPGKILQFISQMTGYSRKWQPYSEVAYHENYIIKLRDLLGNTTKETLANYIGWKTVEYFAMYLSKPIRDKYMEYLNKNLDEPIDRFQFCLEDTKTRFNLVSETMYIREYITPEIKSAGEDLVNVIRDEFKTFIENVEDISNQTKASLFKYYDDMEIVIGAPDEIFDDVIFDRTLYVGQISFSFINTIHMITQWSQGVFNAKMRTVGERSTNSLLNFAYIANRGFGIYLNGDFQAILLPATLFNGVIFGLGRPKYLNYASLGSLIAKKFVEMPEIAHNFSIDFTDEQDECMIHSVTSFNSHLSPQWLVEKNYPDLLGRHIAYNAYQKYVEENGEESALPGLPYSPNVLFWIKSSINWCYQDLPNTDSNPFLQDMLKYRIIETAKHSPYFGEDFMCEVGAKMNPARKCPIN